MPELFTDLLDRIDSQRTTFSSLIVLASALVPMIGAAGLWTLRQPDRKTQGAVALAATWNAVCLLAANVLAVRFGWWTFAEAGPAIAGVPIVLWLGWTVLWGVIAPLFPARPSMVLAGLAVFDLVYMPLMEPVLDLGPNWLIGEVLLLALIAWPTLLHTQWTLTDSHLRERALLQVALFAGILLWAIPALTTAVAGTALHLDVPFWAYGAVLVGLGAPALPAVIAVHDFFLNGATPWPWDRTERPVRSGPYRYVRSPMQASALLLLVPVAFLYGEPLIALAIGSALLYSRLFNELESADLSNHFGPAWSDLALTQRRWIPSWRPNAKGEAAVVWINFGCDVCVPIASFLEARSPISLQIRDAADYPETLTRLRYERADGASFHGVAGVGACLEHLHLGWAMIGWTLRIPVLWRFWQLIGDAVGFGPRVARLSTRMPNELSSRQAPGQFS